MARPPSIARRLFQAAAERLADVHKVPADNRAAYVDQVAIVIEQVFCDAFGGERIKLWFATKPPAQAAALRERIHQAIAAGEAPQVIARREVCSERWVRKLRQQMSAEQTAEQTGP